jgi:hypothetical protein
MPDPLNINDHVIPGILRVRDELLKQRRELLRDEADRLREAAEQIDSLDGAEAEKFFSGLSPNAQSALQRRQEEGERRRHLQERELASSTAVATARLLLRFLEGTPSIFAADVSLLAQPHTDQVALDFLDQTVIPQLRKRYPRQFHRSDSKRWFGFVEYSNACDAIVKFLREAKTVPLPQVEPKRSIQMRLKTIADILQCEPRSRAVKKKLAEIGSQLEKDSRVSFRVRLETMDQPYRKAFEKMEEDHPPKKGR